VTDFHTFCDMESVTITVIKSTTGWIFGGFSDAPWQTMGGNSFSSTSFMFTFTNSFGIPLRLDIVGGNLVNAVFYDPLNGPSFGLTDLRTYDSPYGLAGSINILTYAAPQISGVDQTGVNGGIYIVGGTDGTFDVDEIEVFQLALGF
jgi:hypothetical protein